MAMLQTSSPNEEKYHQKNFIKSLSGGGERESS
jgi:hypothetical protein